LLRLSVFVRGEAVATRDGEAEPDLPEEVLRDAPLGEFAPYDPGELRAGLVRIREPDALAGADDRPEVDFVLFAAAMGVNSGAAASVRMAILQEFRVLGLRL
jgi:hypothetical protein